MEQSETQITFPSKGAKKDIIRKLKEKKEELGKSPTERDVSSSLAYAAQKHFGSWNRAKEKAGLEIFKLRRESWSKEETINRLKELADELGRSPVTADDPNLASAAKKHFGSWNAAKEKAGLKTFSGGFPCARDRIKNISGESEKMEMVKLSIRISNSTDPGEIEFLARELVRLKGVSVGERPRDLHPSDVVDWAKLEARWILKEHPKHYLLARDGWAEETYNKMVGEKGGWKMTEIKTLLDVAIKQLEKILKNDPEELGDSLEYTVRHATKSLEAERRSLGGSTDV